jgi:hypothetical protein
VRAFFDDRALHAARRRFDAHADSIVRTLARRGHGMRSDLFTGRRVGGANEGGWQGWTTEFRIPFSQFRFTRADVQD